MSKTACLARTALVVLGLAGTVFTPAVAAPKKGPKPQVNWWVNEFTYLKRAPKEPGAPANDGPVKLAPSMVEQDLTAIRFNDDEPLFGKDEIPDLVPIICGGVAQCQPNEDLIMVSTSQHGGGLLASRTAVTARLFVRQGRLNLIIRDARFAFYDRYLGTHTKPEFTYGSRTTPGTVDLTCLGAEKLRGDWLTFPVILEEEKAPTAMTAAQPAAAVPVPAPAPAAAAAPAPAPGATAAPVPAPSAQVKDKAYYDQQQERLRGLKRMREENLLTEEEYKKKVQQIIDEL